MKALFLTRNKTSVQMGTRYERGGERVNFIFRRYLKLGCKDGNAQMCKDLGKIGN